MKTLVLDGQRLTLDNAVAALRSGAVFKVSAPAKKKVQKARRVIEDAIRDKQVIYGVTTGFGAFADVVMSRAQGKQLQKNILRSHAAGVGPPFSDEVVRCILLLMINSKAKGYSGLRLSTLDALLRLLNKGVCPVVPEQGSVGASGDLAPLAHLALVLIGKGQARYRGRTLSGAQALRQAGIPPVELAEGEGLALVNGAPQRVRHLAVGSVLGAILCVLTIKISNVEFDFYRYVGSDRHPRGLLAAALPAFETLVPPPPLAPRRCTDAGHPNTRLPRR